MNFEKDWRGVIPSVLWGWIAFCIPTVVKILDVFSTSYSVDLDAGILEYKHGVINRVQDNIDLYRIKNVSANESLISGGKITITNQDGSIIILPYIKNANGLSVKIRNLANKKRQEISTLELM